MLPELGSLLTSGTLQLVVAKLSDVFTASLHAVSSLLDLPVDGTSLESSIRFVKSSGFETSGQLPVLASVGLTIGGGRVPTRSRESPEDSEPYVSRSSGYTDIGTNRSQSSKLQSSSPSGFNTVVPRAMMMFLVLDVLSILLVRQSALNPCVSKLGIIQWVVGGLLMGFPATLLVDSVRHEYSFRAAFVVELIMVVISFMWLCYGGSLVFNTVSACVDSIAPLWWVSYASSVLSLSIAGTVIFCMVVTTVLSLVYGSAQSK